MPAPAKRRGPTVPPKPPPTQRETWLATGRVFLLLAVGLVAFGIYKYVEIDDILRNNKFEFDIPLHVNLTDWGGPAAVLGFYLVAALIMLGASILGYVHYYRLPKDQEPPS
jgi:hypothetical protein